MALNTKRANALVNMEADGALALLNNGYLRIYQGTQPADADASLGAAVLLAEARFAATASAGAAVAGVCTAAAISPDTDANATGTAEFYRAFKSDGTTPVVDGSAGTGTVDCVLQSASIILHQTVPIDSFVYNANKG